MPEAIQDREAIDDCIQADNPIAALALDELFEKMAGRLVDHPGVSRPGRVAGTLGLDALLRTLVVVWTEHAGDRIRIISARKASRGEARHYPRD